MLKKLKFYGILFSTIILFVGLSFLEMSCMGDNPPVAPFGSTVSIINPPTDITSPQEAITMSVVEALVLSPEGLPLNDVLVEWRLFGAGVNDLLFDTDGDGVPDVGGLQLIDNKACDGSLKCSQIEIPVLLSTPAFRDAFVDTPFLTLTNKRGISEIAILISGEVVFDPTTLEASLLNGSVDSADISLNN